MAHTAKVNFYVVTLFLVLLFGGSGQTSNPRLELMEAEWPLAAARFRRLPDWRISRLQVQIRQSLRGSVRQLQVSLVQPAAVVPRFFSLYEEILRTPIPEAEIEAYAKRREALEDHHPDHDDDSDLHEHMDWVLPQMTVVQGLGMWVERSRRVKFSPPRAEEALRLLKKAEYHTHPLVSGLARAWSDRFERTGFSLEKSL